MAQTKKLRDMTIDELILFCRSNRMCTSCKLQKTCGLAPWNLPQFALESELEFEPEGKEKSK